MDPYNEWRINNMLSYYNMVLAYALFIISKQRLYKHASTRVLYDVAAALAVLVALAVLLFYVFFGFKGAQRFYTNLIGAEVPIWFAFVLDTFVHFIPFVLLGMPSNPYAFFAAFAIIVVWYLAIRKNFDRVYDNAIFTEFVDDAMLFKLPTAVVVLAVLTHLVRSRKK